MKHLVLSALVALSFNANAYYEDIPEVYEIGASGGFTIEHLSEDCSTDYPDILVMPGRFGKNGLCMSQIRFEEQAYAELDQMADEQFQNESDYDARITDVFAFEHEGYLTWNGSVNQSIIEDLEEAFNLAEGTTKNFQVRPMNTHSDPLRPFSSYLSIGDVAAEIERFYIGRELTELLKGQEGLHLTFSKEVGLYPGGGINVIYHFFLMEGKTVYVKEVYWNS